MTTNRFVTLINGIQNLVTAISTSAGVADANKIVATGADGRLANSLMPVGIGAAVATIVASEALAAGDFVNIWNNAGTRNVRKADASNNRPAHGFVLSSVASAASATVYQQGENTGLTGLTPGEIRFLSATTAGTSTTAPPSTAGHLIQELGVSYSATSLLFEFNPFTILG